MKVLFINTVYGRGSTGRIVADLGRMLEENGHEYRVAYGRGDHSDDPHCYRVGNDFDMYIHAGLSRITDRAGFYSKEATRKLVEFIKDYDPDIIHLHNLHGYYVNIEILFNFLAEEYKGRVIWTLHDCWAFTGHCTYYSFAQCYKWKDVCFSCCQKKQYPCARVLDQSKRNHVLKKALYTKLGKRLEIVTVSHWLEKQVQVSILASASIRTIYNGVDTELFKYRQNRIKKKLNIEEKIMILAVSDGWDTRKGFDNLFELAKGLDKTAVLVVIGLNKKQIRGLPANVIGMERTWNQDELIEYYSAADVFFNPSKEETFGLVTAEALACGTPAVVYNTTACPELIEDKRTGRIINLDSDAKVYASTISDVKAKEKKCLLNKKFSQVEFLRQYKALYIGDI